MKKIHLRKKYAHSQYPHSNNPEKEKEGTVIIAEVMKLIIVAVLMMMTLVSMEV